MRIRRATGDEMLRLWGYTDADPVSPTARFFCANLSSGNAVSWALDDGGELIGELYAFLDLDDKDFADGKDTAYLCAFRVREEYRGRGLGSSLLKHALSELREMGFRKATIGVEEDEPWNLRLYRRFGFLTVVKECHYDPCGMDADMQPVYEEDAWWLLSKDLRE
jgi:ribosomal protein S18 acetylase RimI-like enzyme